MRRQTAIQALSLLLGLSASAVHAGDNAAAKEEILQSQQRPKDIKDPNPPRSAVEKNKRAKMNKGRTNANPAMATRVVGGQQVTQESKYPFFVEWEDAKCGASLVWGDIALSAAHCESSESPFNTRVFVNGITSEAGVFRTIQRQVSHPLYKEISNNDYDVMILKLHSSALVDENGDATGAELVTLNTNNDLPSTGDPLIAVGYGLTEEGGSSTSPVLNDVEVNYVADSACEGQYGTTTYNPALMFCAGVDGGGKDTCQGDSGGPIMIKDTMEQAGVVSFGIGCARENYNGVYARVSMVTEWINEMICDLSDDPPSSCGNNGGSNSNSNSDDSNDSSDDGNNGNGDISVEVTYDNYSRETAISLVNAATGDQLYFQPYDADNASNGQTETFTFTDLAAGQYTMLVGDDGRDGLCCAYGSGSIKLIDNKFSNTAWEIGEFGEFKGANFDIAADGRIENLEEITDYLSSWELSPNPANYPQAIDQSWPGPKPSDNAAINVNIRFDRFPDEVRWELYEESNGAWSLVEDFDGSTDGAHNNLLSIQITGLADGWYRYVITDSGNDGVCCSYRRGWVALTGKLLATRRSGLVWGNNGEFGGSTEVYFEISSGHVIQITDTTPI